MELDRRSTHRPLCVEAGSAIVEGIAAVAITFILFSLVVQVSVALLAHQAATSTVASAAREVSFGGTYSAARLRDELRATVPGAGEVEAGVEAGGLLARAWAEIEFIPPGPLFGPRRISVEAEVPVVVTP